MKQYSESEFINKLLDQDSNFFQPASQHFNGKLIVERFYKCSVGREIPAASIYIIRRIGARSAEYFVHNTTRGCSPVHPEPIENLRAAVWLACEEVNAAWKTGRWLTLEESIQLESKQTQQKQKEQSANRMQPIIHERVLMVQQSVVLSPTEEIAVTEKALRLLTIHRENKKSACSHPPHHRRLLSNAHRAGA